MRINIALPLPAAFRYELEKKTGALREILFKSSPHYMWLDKTEWRVTLGFLGKVDDVIDIERVCMAVEQEVFGFGFIVGVTGKVDTFPKEYNYYRNRNNVGLSFKRGSDRIAELSRRIADKINGLLSNKYIQCKSPYITLVRKDRKRRPCFPVGWIEKLEALSLECILIRLLFIFLINELTEVYMF